MTKMNFVRLNGNGMGRRESNEALNWHSNVSHELESSIGTRHGLAFDSITL